MANLKSLSTEGGNRLLTDNVFNFGGSTDSTLRYLVQHPSNNTLVWQNVPSNIVISQTPYAYTTSYTLSISPSTAFISEPTAISSLPSTPTTKTYTLTASNLDEAVDIYWEVQHIQTTDADFSSPTSGVLSFPAANFTSSASHTLTTAEDEVEGVNEAYKVIYREFNESGKTVASTTTSYILDGITLEAQGIQDAYNVGAAWPGSNPAPFPYSIPYYTPSTPGAKMPFSSEVWSTAPYNWRGPGVRSGSSSSSLEHGYIHGGFDYQPAAYTPRSWYYGYTYRFAFADGSVTTNTSSLTPQSYGGSGISSKTHGYALGFGVSPFAANYHGQKWPFSSWTSSTYLGDLSITPPATLDLNSAGQGSYETGNQGLLADSSNVYKFPFSNETLAQAVSKPPTTQGYHVQSSTPTSALFVYPSNVPRASYSVSFASYATSTFTGAPYSAGSIGSGTQSTSASYFRESEPGTRGLKIAHSSTTWAVNDPSTPDTWFGHGTFQQ